MHSRRGFTLVELLVVIAIIGLLVALLIPAVQAAREAARRVQCANNFKQVALATLNHALADEHLPALLDARYEGEVSWRYTILPFLEESAIYDKLSDASPWWVVRVERTSAPMKPAIVPTYFCASTPGNPRFGVAAQVVSRGVTIFDAVSVQDIFAISWVRSTETVGAYAAAWSGQKRASGDTNSLKNERNPAKLKWITDGMSKTILNREVAGFPA